MENREFNDKINKVFEDIWNMLQCDYDLGDLPCVIGGLSKAVAKACSYTEDYNQSIELFYELLNNIDINER